MKDMDKTKKRYSITIPEDQANNILRDVMSYREFVPVDVNGIEGMVLISSKDLEQLRNLEKEDNVDENFDRARANIGEAFKDTSDDEILANLDRIRKELRDNNSTD